MPADKLNKKETVRLTTEDFQAALRLLSTETSAARMDYLKFALTVLAYLSLAAAVVSGLLGLIIIWADRTLGLWLLGVAGGASAVFAVIAILRPDVTQIQGATSKIQSEMSRHELGQASASRWAQISYRLNLAAGVLLIVGALAVLAGVGWLIFSLLTPPSRALAAREPSLAAMILIALPILAFVVLAAVSNFWKFHYFSQVSRLRGQFQQRLEQTGPEQPNAFEVAAKDMDLLSRIEVSQTAQQAIKAAANFEQKRGGFYGVVMTPDALEYLRQLPDEQREARYAIRDLTDSLQVDRRPLGASPLPGQADTFVIGAGRYEVVYRVDDARELVEVTRIRPMYGKEASSAS